MKITALNWDDIVREIKNDLHSKGELPSGYTIIWGKEGTEACERFFGAVVCIKHGVLCDFCGEDGLKPKKNEQFLGIRHSFDKRKNGYEVIKTTRTYYGGE